MGLGLLAFAAGLFYGVASSAFAAESALLLDWGDCRLETSSSGDVFVPGLSLCARGRVGGEAVFAAGDAPRNQSLEYAEGSLHLLAGRFVSYYVSGEVARGFAVGRAAESWREARSETSVVRLGNPAFHRYWVTAGRMNLPFGFHRSSATEFHDSFVSRRFWESPRYGVAAHFDDHRRFRGSLSVANNSWTPGLTAPWSPEPQESGDRPRTTPDLGAAATRLMYDIPALGGTRVAASGYTDTDGRKRAGLGVLTSADRHVTHVEWIRLFPPEPAPTYRQLVRVGYRQRIRGGQRWRIQYDSERDLYRMGTVAWEQRLASFLRVRLGMTYHAAEHSDRHRTLYFMTGMEGHL